MGTSICQSHSASAVQPREASKNAGIPFSCCGQHEPSLGGGRIADLDTSRCFPVLCRPYHIPAKCQRPRLLPHQCVDWALLDIVCIHHLHADDSSRQPILYTAFCASRPHFWLASANHRWDGNHVPFIPFIRCRNDACHTSLLFHSHLNHHLLMD